MGNPPTQAFQNNFQDHCSTIEDDGGVADSISMVASEQYLVFGALDKMMLLKLIPILCGSFQASFKEDIVSVLQMQTLQKAQRQVES